jgi:hypothetical protein
MLTTALSESATTINCIHKNAWMIVSVCVLAYGVFFSRFTLGGKKKKMK